MTPPPTKRTRSRKSPTAPAAAPSVGRPALRVNAKKTSLYLEEEVIILGKAQAKNAGISFGQLVSDRIRGISTDEVVLTEIDGVMVPTNLIDPYYADNARATKVDTAFSVGDDFYDRGVVIWWETAPRPGDLLLLKSGEVVEWDSDSPPAKRSVRGVVISAYRLL